MSVINSSGGEGQVATTNAVLCAGGGRHAKRRVPARERVARRGETNQVVVVAAFNRTHKNQNQRNQKNNRYKEGM